MTALPDLSVLAAYSLAVAILTLTPGPDMAFFLGRAVAGGRPAGLAAFFGAATGLVIHSALVALGLAAVLAASATAFLILKIAGAAYLVHLAIAAIRHGGAFAVDGSGPAAEPLARVYLKGLAINLLNPKIIVFFVTFLPQFVDAGDPDAAGRLFFLGFWFVVVAIPLTLPMIFAADRIAALLRRRPKALRAVDYGFAAVMAAFAIRLATAVRG